MGVIVWTIPIADAGRKYGEQRYGTFAMAHPVKFSLLKFEITLLGGPVR